MNRSYGFLSCVDPTSNYSLLLCKIDSGKFKRKLIVRIQSIFEGRIEQPCFRKGQDPWWFWWISGGTQGQQFLQPLPSGGLTPSVVCPGWQYFMWKDWMGRLAMVCTGIAMCKSEAWNRIILKRKEILVIFIYVLSTFKSSLNESQFFCHLTCTNFVIQIVFTMCQLIIVQLYSI